MLRRFLFETQVGDLALYWLEGLTGLALVPVDTLAGTRADLVSPADPDPDAGAAVIQRGRCRVLP